MSPGRGLTNGHGIWTWWFCSAVVTMLQWMYVMPLVHFGLRHREIHGPPRA